MGNSRIPRLKSRIPNLEFLATLNKNSRIPRLKSRIPYRDPRVKPEDNIVGNSRISKAKSRIPRGFLRL